jgi:hypothetical protein
MQTIIDSPENPSYLSAVHNELDVVFSALSVLLPDPTFFLRVYFPNKNPPVKIEWRPPSLC